MRSMRISWPRRRACRGLRTSGSAPSAESLEAWSAPDNGNSRRPTTHGNMVIVWPGPESTQHIGTSHARTSHVHGTQVARDISLTSMQFGPGSLALAGARQSVELAAPSQSDRQGGEAGSRSSTCSTAKSGEHLSRASRARTSGASRRSPIRRDRCSWGCGSRSSEAAPQTTRSPPAPGHIG